MDTTDVGRVAAELMDVLAADQAEADGELKVGIVMVLAEVTGSDDRGDWTGIRFRCSDPRVWIQNGMLHAALGDERVVDEDDE